LYFWAAVLAWYSFAMFGVHGEWRPNLTEGFHNLLFVIVPVYFNLALFDRLFAKRRYALYAFLLIAGLGTNAFVMSYVYESLYGRKASMVVHFPLSVFFVCGTTGLRLIRREFENRILLQELKSKQLQIELGLLKSQINPHFLFNTLNNLFSMSRRNDPGTSDGIARLAHVMRYMIHEGNSKTIGLDKEAEQIQRIIDLQRVRFSKEDPVQIEFTTTGDLGSVSVPPMILVPFVENAFKHGINFTKPSFVRIKLEHHQKRIIFTIVNSIHLDQSPDRDTKSGIGLQNVKRQLEILFPNSHQLLIQRDEATFNVSLTLHPP
jgi:hypothetical protein